MERQEQGVKSRVVKVESSESWDLLVTEATNKGCPVVVHFTAAWCIPSVAMKSFLEELAMGYQDVLFLVVDVDEVKEVATKLDIKAMPTFVLMKEGTPVDKLVGANPEEIRKRIGGFVESIRSYKA
ncbi:PREDICTED: thioredoxin-like protein CXXS1 [Nelumbo nucifera]|uniref:Thioredoxin-like protein CXXS1 n=1 Tax=Nelumbo nucifera TaxID=4432 RepID=A0A1U7ZHC7_NELNU|nr:PREDICTED: thioredoxin-like protein CXXS1 [Nelumbo nucifera]